MASERDNSITKLIKEHSIKFLHKIIFTLFIATTSSALHAESYYFGGGYFAGSYVEGDPDPDFDLDLNIDALFYRYGYQINSYSATEFRAAFGVGDDSKAMTVYGINFDLDVSIESYLGVYYKIGIPSETLVFPYVILGYTNMVLNYEIDQMDYEKTGSDSDYSYGLGADFDIGDIIMVNAEYMVYLDKGGVEIAGFSVGVSYRF